MTTTKYPWCDTMEIKDEICGISTRIALNEYDTKKELKSDIQYLKELARELEKAINDGLEYNPTDR